MKEKIRSVFAEQIKNWLSDIELRQLLIRNGHKKLPEITFDHLVRWYVQVDENGRDNYSAGGVIERFRHCKMSKQALISCRLIIRDEKNIKKSKAEKSKKLKDIVHYEHNVPVKVMKQKLLQIETPFTLNEVEKVLNNDYEVIIISKDERKRIDSSKYKDTGEFSERLKYANVTLINTNEKVELINEINTWLNKKTQNNFT
jgi:hypothetical protein